MRKIFDKNNQKGFSIMELLIVMVVMLIVLGAVFSLMRGTIITSNTNFEMTTASQGLRNAQEYITRDLLVVGDGLKGVSNIWVPTDFVTKYLTARKAAVIDPSNRGFVSIGGIVSDEKVPAGVEVADTDPQITVLPGSDRITLLMVDPSFSPIPLPANSTTVSTGEIRIPGGNTSKFNNGEIYYITGSGNGSFGTLTRKTGGSIYWEEGDSFGLNRFGNTGNIATAAGINGSQSSTLMRVNMVHYFIDEDERLTRRVFGVKEKSFIDNTVAEHVVSLKFRYVLKPDTNSKIYEKPITQVDLSDASMIRVVEPAVEVKTAYPLQSGEYEKVEGMTQIGVRNLQFSEAPVPLDALGNTDLPNPGPTPVSTPMPTPTPTPKPTPLPTPTPTKTPTPSPTKTPTPSPTKTPTPSPTKTPTPSPTKTPTPSPTKTPTPSPTKTPTPTPTPTPRGKGEG